MVRPIVVKVDVNAQFLSYYAVVVNVCTKIVRSPVTHPAVTCSIDIIHRTAVQGDFVPDDGV